MFWMPRPETTRSQLTRPLRVLRRYSSRAISRLERAAKSQWPPSEGMGRVGLAVPDEERLAEAGAGGDEALVAAGVGVAGVEGEYLVGRELGDAVAVGLEVVDEEDVRDAERVLEVAAVEGPGKIGELEAAVADGAGDAEAGGGDVLFVFGAGAEEVFDCAFEAGEFVGGEFLVAYGDEVAFGHVVEREMNLGAAYVACENHLAELQCAGVG